VSLTDPRITNRPVAFERLARLASVLLSGALLAVLAPAAAAGLRVETLPAQPLVERARDSRQLDFDLLFHNPGDQALELVGLELTWFDRDGRFAGQRRLDRNGDSTTMSILTVPNRTLPAGGRLVVFNPFARFPADAWLGDQRVEALFAAGDDAPEQRVTLRLAPRVFEPATPLSLPLHGEVFVHDGHDLDAHHRRLDITGAMTTHFGITGNFMRHAHDFVVTDAQGRLFRDDGARPEDWFGWGAPVLATGDGVVLRARDGMRDNRKGEPPPFEQAAIMQDLTLFLGNHVVVDHGNGEFSLFAHLREGSVAVKPGQKVARGEPLGAMGMSGDAFLVHLHYQLQSGPGFEEGLPAVFEGVRVRTGDGWSAPYTGTVDSGEVVEAVAR
jgi:murein DD-endopeptidase MepM/ murein hydrolase activator NlpD